MFILDGAVFAVVLSDVLESSSQSMQDAMMQLALDQEKSVWKKTYVLMIAVMKVPRGN